MALPKLAVTPFNSLIVRHLDDTVAGVWVVDGVSPEACGTETSRGLPLPRRHDRTQAPRSFHLFIAHLSTPVITGAGTAPEFPWVHLIISPVLQLPPSKN